MNIQDFADDNLLHSDISIEDIKSSLSTGKEIKPNMGAFASLDTSPMVDPNVGKVGRVDYNVPIDAVYKKLRDGSYTPMFENYKGAFDNEDRLAKEQGFFESIGSGLGRLGSKAGMYALDATIGTAVGITDAIGSGKWSDIWDNDFSTWVDDVNTTLDYSLPTYKSNDYKSKNILENIFTHPLTFLTGDLADGLAFVAGAALPEAAIAVATGGASLPTSFAKVGAKLGLKSLGKQAAKDQALKMSRTFLGSKVGDVTGNVLKTSGFLARTSNFEASVEARHNFHESVDSYMNTFYEENGKMPSVEELDTFMEGAASAANGVHLANLAILSVSNTAMFGKTFGVLNKQRQAVNSFGNRLIGLKPKMVDGQMALGKATKGQKVLGTASKILSKPITEGLYEEGLQGVAGETMQKYLESTYDPKYEPSYDVWSALQDGFAHTYGTKEGWNEIGLGMIIGSIGGTMMGQSVAGFGKDSYGAQRSRLQKMVDGQNQSYEKLGSQITKNLNHANSARAYRESLEQNPDSPMADTEATILGMEFIKSQEHLKNPNQILEEYTNIVNATELDEQTVAELGGSQEAISDYKNQMISSFQETADAYKKADALVRRLGINEAAKLDTGNGMAVQDYVKTALVLGETSKTRMQRIGQDIDAIIGEDGSFNAMKFYTNLSERNKQELEQLEQDQKKLDKLKGDYEGYTRRLAGIQESPGLSDSKLEQRRNSVAEKRMLLGQQVIELEEKIDRNKQTLQEKYKATDASLESDILGAYDFDTVLGNLNKIDKISRYAQVMEENGMEQESAVLTGLVEQFKDMSDMVRESDNLVRKMADTNFLTSNRWQGLLGSIVGTKYEMSPEFRQQIRDNDQKIDQQLGKVGIRGYGKVEAYLEAILENNPNLSEREKFRLETIIRLQLNIDSITEKFNEEAAQEEEIQAEKGVSTTPMDGDTITLRRTVDMAEEGSNSVKQIDEMITEMLNAIEEIRVRAGKKRRSDDPEIQNQIKGKRDKIAELQEQIAAIESGQTATKVNKEKLALEERKESLTTKARENYNEAVESYTGRTPEDVKAINKIISELGNSPQDKAREKGLQLLVDEITYENQLDDKIDQESLKKKEKEKIDKINEQIKNIEAEIEDIMSLDVPRIVESEDYQRLDELNTKRSLGQELTNSEITELTELEASMDAWLQATGAVAQGYRLSDLIRLRSQLADTPIRQVEDLQEVTPLQKRRAGNFQDKGTNPNYHMSQNYGAVTAATIKDGKEVVISGMSYEELQELAEAEFEQVPNEYENKRGNTVITSQVKDFLNESSKLKILPPGENQLTVYTTVMVDVGDGVLEPVMSNFGRDFNGKAMNTDVLYEVQESNQETQTKGDIVKLYVDPKDPYNVGLIESYKNAKTKKARKEALEELKEGLVIKTGVRSTFAGVLKSKRPGAVKTRQDIKKFEAMRNQLINDENFLRQITETETQRELPISGVVRAQKVWLGMPNQVHRINDQGQVVVEEQNFTEQDVKNVVDIGYVHRGKVMTRSKNKGINTTFIDNVKNNDKLKGKTPFIVFQKGKQRIAYPVTLKVQETPDTTEFTTIYNSDAALESKVFKMNDMLAGYGIDIKQQGDYFDFQNIGNQDFFNQKLAQIENMSYFYNLDSWITKTDSIADILIEQATIDINMSNPIHSPKLQLDYSGLEVDMTNFEGETNTAKSKLNKFAKDKVEKNKKEDCPK